MNKNIFLKTHLFLLLGISAVTAGMPVAPGSHRTASLDYTFSMDGVSITDEKVRTHLWNHQVNYAYAPCEFFELGLGVGAAKYDVVRSDSTLFDGNFQFSPMAHITLSTPAFIREIVRLRLQGNVQRFQSEEHSLEYSANIYDASGLLVLQSHCWQVELGGGARWYDGSMENKTRDDEFSNYYLGRGILNFQHISRNGIFWKLGLQANANTKGWHDGPTESQISFSIGYLMRDKRKLTRNGELDRYFPAVPSMRKQQESMDTELQDSSTKDR